MDRPVESLQFAPQAMQVYADRSQQRQQLRVRRQTLRNEISERRNRIKWLMMECTRVEAECAQREAEYSEVQRREDQLSDELDHLATSLSLHQHQHHSEPPFHQSSMALSPEKSSESPGTSGQSEAAEVEDDTLRQQLARILGHDPVDTQQFDCSSGQLATTEEGDAKFLSGKHISSNAANVTECYVDSSPVFTGYTLRDALEHSPSSRASTLRKRMPMPSNTNDSPKKRKWGRLNGITLDELRGHAARMNQWWDRKTKRFRCPVCDNASVKSRDKAIRHVLDHFDDKTYFPYQCPVDDCSYLSIRMDHVIAHYRGTHKKQEWNDHLRTCSIIVENKVIIDALFEDTKATVPQARCLPYKCPLDGCNYISDQLEYVRAHVTGLHKLEWSDAMLPRIVRARGHPDNGETRADVPTTSAERPSAIFQAIQSIFTDT